MQVTEVARSIGLVAVGGDTTGTIDQEKVLGALAELTQSDPENADLFGEAAVRVRTARSAGVEVHRDVSSLVRPLDGDSTQLRYRSEMADLFTDLAIDVGLRRRQKLVATA